MRRSCVLASCSPTPRLHGLTRSHSKKAKENQQWRTKRTIYWNSIAWSRNHQSWPQLISRHVWVYLGPRNPGSDSLAPQRWSRPKNLQLDISTILPRRRPAIPHSSVAATINQVTSEFHSHWESRDHPARGGRSLIWFSFTGCYIFLS